MPRSPPRSESKLETWECYCAERKRPCARRSTVRHLSDGTLRRIYDEPLALTAADQSHFDDCADCRARFESIANTARATTALLSVPGFAPEPTGALKSVRARIGTEEAAHPPRWYGRWLNQGSPRCRAMATPAGALLPAATLLNRVAGAP